MIFLKRCIVALGCLMVASATSSAHAQAAHVVIMLDITGSTSLGDLESERNAAKSLLDQFSVMPVRPFVSIGTFDVAEANAARIISGGAPTNIYGTSNPATGLYAAIDAIQLTGGMTDLGAAINVGRAQLELAPAGASKYLVLISDGTPNRPGAGGYEACGECGCPTAYGAASAAAASAEQAGIKIFGIHYAGNGFTYCNLFGEPQNGMNFMRQEIASLESYFYEGTQNLTGIFGEIFCAISCDDGDPCTVDSCDSQVGQCVHTVNNADADNDQVVDCRDQCNGDDALLGTVCGQVTEPVACTRSLGSWSCSTEKNLICAGGVVLDPVVCFGCQDISEVPSVDALRASIKQQSDIALALTKRLRKSGITEKSVKRYSTKTRKEIDLVMNGSTVAAASLPETFKSCVPAVSGVCQQVNQAPALETIGRNAETIESVIRKVGRKLRQRGALTKRDRKAIRSRTAILKSISESVAKFPKFHSECL